MSIYKDVLDLEQMLPESGDEATQKLIDSILSEGLERLCKVRANKQARVIALKEEEARIANQRKSEEKQLENINHYISMLLEKAGGKQEAGSFRLSFRTSKSVNVKDIRLIPDEYILEKVTASIDKKKIKEDIESGVIIDGAELDIKQNLQVK